MRFARPLAAGILLAATVAAAAQAPRRGDARAGKKTYEQLCASCHGPEGKGDGPAAAALNPRPKDLSDDGYAGKLSDRYLFEVIKGGGPKVKKSPLMPAWGHTLKDQEIWNLVAYLRSIAAASSEKESRQP
jgi:mono/diheme cytochrome c family protein